MKPQKNNLELKMYEFLGIKKFRNAIVNILYIACIPIYKISNIPKEEMKKIFLNTPGNYFMKKGNGLNDLKNFKKFIWFNAIIHVIALILTATVLYINPVFNTIFVILNLYCIMLQRYNYIRINKTIRKHKIFEENKICKIKTELKEKDNLLKEYIYTFGLVGKNKKIKTIDQLLENASLERLKQIKIILEDISNKEKIYEKYPNLIYSSTIFEEKNKNYCLKISRNKQ